MRGFRHCMATVLMGLMAAACAGRAQPPDATSPTTPPPANVIDVLRQQLREEARSLQMSLKPPARKPDIATRFEPEVPPTSVVAMLCERNDADGFADGYVRWQLTSFDPDLDGVTDEQFAALLRTAPPLLDNPRAGRRYLRFMRHMNDVEALPPGDVELVETRLADVSREAALVESFRFIGEGLRGWVDRKLERDPGRRLVWRVEWCAASLRAGWPVDERARAIDELMTAEAIGGIDAARRGQFVERIRRLATVERTVVTGVTIEPDRTVTVELEPVTLAPERVERWIEA
ncbi:MAG: hypothetical protein ACYTGC_07920, partial [Planctomycetota bacterium]